MSKPAEEGKIWEWRAFGRINDELAEKVRAYPIRLGIDDLRGQIFTSFHRSTIRT